MMLESIHALCQFSAVTVFVYVLDLQRFRILAILILVRDYRPVQSGKNVPRKNRKTVLYRDFQRQL